MTPPTNGALQLNHNRAAQDERSPCCETPADGISEQEDSGQRREQDFARQFRVGRSKGIAPTSKDGRQKNKPTEEPVKSDVPDTEVGHGLLEQNIHGRENAG